MAKFGVVLVSHSEYIAKGLKELVDEMNDGSVQVVAAGGADGGRIGTSAIKIQQAIESVEDCGHILIYADLGSSILSAETAMDLIDEDLAEKVQIVDAPIVEGALAVLFREQSAMMWQTLLRHQKMHVMYIKTN